jgi:cytochrome c oxidase cbb3-type subunit 3
MTSGWSLFVILLTIVNILACVWLLRWTSKPKSATEKIGGGADTGHVWDKDLREYNNPLPKWWLWLFYITVAFGLLYLVLYPGLGTVKGIKGWTQAGQWEQENAAAEAKVAAYLAPFASMSVPELAANPQAMATAHNLFQNNCAQCHGSDGGGARGFPNLANADWQWGGDPDTIVQSIAGGRVAAGMVAWGPALGEQGVEKVVAYVQKLSGQQHDAALAAEGEQLFLSTGCVGCHGMDGKGMAAVGAPNLTDDVWLYGGDAGALRETVTNGRAGQMPAFQDKLGEQRVRLLAAYVLKLSGGAQ